MNRKSVLVRMPPYAPGLEADVPIFNSISNTEEKGPVVNKIAKALLERVLSAARAGEKFRVCALFLVLKIGDNRRVLIVHYGC